MGKQKKLTKGQKILLTILVFVALFIFLGATVFLGSIIDIQTAGTETGIEYGSGVVNFTKGEWNQANTNLTYEIRTRGVLTRYNGQIVFKALDPVSYEMGMANPNSRAPFAGLFYGTDESKNSRSKGFDTTREDYFLKCKSFLDGEPIGNEESFSLFGWPGFSEPGIQTGSPPDSPDIIGWKSYQFKSVSRNLGSIPGGMHILELRCKTDGVNYNQIINKKSVYKEDPLCGKINNGYVMYTETRVGGTPGKSIFNKSTTDFPVEAVCPLMFPILKMKSNGVFSEEANDLLILEKGDDLFIPAGEIWKIPYLVKISNALQINCAAVNGIIDESGNCDTKGFADACTGQLNDNATCITTPNDPCPDGVLSNNVCFETQTFNKNCGYLGIFEVDNGRCIRPAGEIGDCYSFETWEFETKQCWYSPLSSCPFFGAQYNLDKQKCEFGPDGYGKCSPGKNYDFNSLSCVPTVPVKSCPDNWDIDDSIIGLTVCDRTPTSDEMCPQDNRTFSYTEGNCRGAAIRLRCDTADGYNEEIIEGVVKCVKNFNEEVYEEITSNLIVEKFQEKIIENTIAIAVAVILIVIIWVRL